MRFRIFLCNSFHHHGFLVTETRSPFFSRSQDGRTALTGAVEKRNILAVKTLYQERCRINAPDGRGLYALDIAIRAEDIKMVSG